LSENVLVIVSGYLRRGFALFQLVAHFLEALSESVNLRLRLRYDRSLCLHFATLPAQTHAPIAIHFAFGVSRTVPRSRGWMEDSQSRRAAHLEVAEFARFLVRFDHVAHFIENTNHSIM
jgi:hypothetical protein